MGRDDEVRHELGKKDKEEKVRYLPKKKTLFLPSNRDTENNQ